MDLAAIEQQRQALETQVQTLRQSLKHWQTLDLEYEGLKEELEAIPSAQLNKQQLIDLSTSYDGILVNTKEIRDLTGLNTNSPREQGQIVGIIDRRLEYVTKNIETISRRFYAAENKLEEFAFASSVASGANPRFDDEPVSALPLIEIHEELDNDGNVVASELRRPEDETRTILETLKKVGAIDEKSVVNEDLDGHHDEDADDSREEHSVNDVTRRPAIRKKSVSFTADTKLAKEPVRSESQEGRKTVSFAPKVAVAPAADPPDTRSVSFAAVIEEIPAQAPVLESPQLQKADPNTEKQKDLRASFKPGEKVYEVNDDEETVQHVVLPQDESPEDAQTRREMLEYHMNEVGSVVAQMDLDELDDHSDFTGSEYHDDGDTPYTSETDDDADEDEHGRSRQRVIGDDYREQMKALQERLIGNLGPHEDLNDDIKLNAQDVHTLVIRGIETRYQVRLDLNGEKKASKKRVSFAAAVDVAELESLPNKVPKVDASDGLESIGEASNDGPILADTLVERDTTQSAVAGPAPEDDEVVARRELAAEYYRRRNDMVKQQGGFKSSQEEDEELGELMEERDGKLKKVSRFKAARLRS